MSGYYRETYEPVQRWAKKSGKCACGKRLTRQTTFEQTLSPFNKKDGRLKMHHEIVEELMAERKEWLDEPVRHDFRWEPGSHAEFREKGWTIGTMTCGVSVKIENVPSGYKVTPIKND